MEIFADSSRPLSFIGRATATRSLAMSVPTDWSTPSAMPICAARTHSAIAMTIHGPPMCWARVNRARSGLSETPGSVPDSRATVSSSPAKTSEAGMTKIADRLTLRTPSAVKSRTNIPDRHQPPTAPVKVSAKR